MPDYDATRNDICRRTAGWFVLGMPFILPVSMGYGFLLILIRRYTNIKITWGTMLVASIFLLTYSWKESSPQSWLQYEIVENAAELCSLEKIQAIDSFCDGIIVIGVVCGNEKTLTTLAQKWGGKIKLMTSTVTINNKKEERNGMGFSDRQRTFFFDESNEKIYFPRHDQIITKKNN